MTRDIRPQCRKFKSVSPTRVVEPGTDCSQGPNNRYLASHLARDQGHVVRLTLR